MVGPDPEKWRSRFLYELRLSRPAREGKRKLTQQEFADELGSKGVPLVREPGATAEAKRIAYNRFEKGTGQPPSDELLAQIAKLYGVPPPQPPAATPAADLSAVVRALEGQTRMIERLAVALEAHFDEQLERGEDQSLFLGVLARILAPPGTDIGRELRSAAADLAALRRESNGTE